MIIDTIQMDSSLRFTLLDQTQHYFGGYYHVKVLAYCDIPLQLSCFENDSEFDHAVTLLGNSVRFERILDKMAVPASDVEAVRNQLIRTFQETAAVYLSSSDFACGFVRSEFQKRPKKSPRTHISRA